METTQIERTSKTCCICLEETQDYISCNDCNEGVYCKSCLNKIKKNDNTYTCSICRRENNNYSIIFIEEATENVATLSTCFYIENIMRETSIFILNALKIIIFLVIAIGIILFMLYMLYLL